MSNKSRHFLTRNLTGFTLVEMIVVVSIVAIISAALFANYREIGDQGRVSSYAGKIREDLRLTQRYGYSGRSNKSNLANGWGIYFNRNLNKYVIFSDLDNGRTYDYPTKLLIHGTEWTSGSSFVDSAQATNTVAIGGNATQVSETGMPTGAGSGYWLFDGTGDSLSVADNNDKFAFGSGDFAIDLWASSTTSGSPKYLLSKGTGVSKVYEFYKDTDDKINFVVYDDTTSYALVSSFSITVNTPYHLAATRKNNVLTLFISGIIASTTPMTTAVRQVSSSVFIGNDGADINTSWAGLIDEVRISKGAKRWTEKFSVPTTAYLADDEFFREVKLPPGLVFDSLTHGGVATSELHVFFDPVTYLMYGYSNGVVSSSEVEIIINNAGAAGTSLSGDTPQTLTVDTSGLINWTH